MFLLGIQLKIDCEAMKCIIFTCPDIIFIIVHKTDASYVIFSKGDKAWNKCNKA